MPRDAEAKRKYDLEYVKKNYARKLELNRLWRNRTGYKPDPKKAVAATRKWQDANPERVKLTRWKRQLRKMYGLTIEEYEAMLRTQQGRCASCNDALTDKLHGRHIDHCHATGKVRGILCGGCNIALGHAKDDVERLKSLIRYLEKSRI